MSNAPHMDLDEINEMLRHAMGGLSVDRISTKINRSRQSVYNQLRAFEIPTNPRYRNPTQIFNMISTGYVKPPYSQKTLVTVKATIDSLIEDLLSMRQTIDWARKEMSEEVM